MMSYKVEIVRKDIAPYGVKCVVCDRIAKEGQCVFRYTVPDVVHVVIHKRCFGPIENKLDELDTLDNSLELEYNSIRNKYLKGEIVNV